MNSPHSPLPPSPWRGDHERGTEAYAWGTDGWMDVGCMKQKGKKENENKNKNKGKRALRFG